jgi:hypothetical protein
MAVKRVSVVGGIIRDRAHVELFVADVCGDSNAGVIGWLQLASQAHSSVRLPGAVVGRGCRVAGDHLPGLPAGEPHQIGFLTSSV